MFGKKKPTEHNVILLDVENASVGVALAHLRQGSAPALFVEHRIALAIPRTLESRGIAKQIENAVHSGLERLGLVAARLRGNTRTAQRGEFTGASIFLGAPWGVPNLAAGKADFSPAMQSFIASEVGSFAPDVPLNFYTSADAAAYSNALLGRGGTTLLALVRGEITELILIGPEGPLGYGTLPMGARSIYRTLQTHAGLTMAEIPAVLALAQQQNNFLAGQYAEPLNAAGRHMVEQFAPALEALAQSGTPEGVVVIAEPAIAEWFARTLEADDSLGTLFTPGATVRTFNGNHIGKHLGARGNPPDLHLGLGALFADAKLFS